MRESGSEEIAQENDTDVTATSQETHVDEKYFADIIIYQIATKSFRKECDGSKKYADSDMDFSNRVLFEGKFVTVMMPEEYAQTYPAMYEALNSIAKTEMEEALSHYKFESKADSYEDDYENAEFPYIWYLSGDGLHIVFNAYDNTT
ncbi:hypothetical protein [Butyrivibrio sp. AC2005]|uniref:hypothetical protein n=1 Tax=Butyrivibrio sp. AC2005 TaxID=1280672 RepID=UPI00047CB2F0|nr:hypothetical protein [Butyrivibrio sp. AC2005]